jgi:leucyl-tRNA synthetase
MNIFKYQKIEKKWQLKWRQKKIFEVDLKKAKKPFFNLMMFPYPSAEGLHVGNVYAFTGADIYGRLKRMQGYDVFEPIGLDGFGINSENYALKIGVHPMKQSLVSERRFYKQLGMIGNGFAWNYCLETYDPSYYQWTQWLFLQMFKHGLAYRKKQAVNWCPSCKTVLADEQVISGSCERCSSIVEKKDLEQWFFRITNYAERLLKNLEKIDWAEKVKIAQRNWIGRSEGAIIEFPVVNSSFKISVFTTRSDTIFGATYIVLSPEHSLLESCREKISNYEEVARYVLYVKSRNEDERIAASREKTGIKLEGIRAINPATQEEIPIFVADYVLGNVGTGAIMAVPAHDQRDFEFAKKFNLPIRVVVWPDVSAKNINDNDIDKAYEADGYLINSGRFNGLQASKVKWEIVKLVGGKKHIQYHLRDWLVSRQRYWGPPIPVIFCENCKRILENYKSKKSQFYYSKGELENPGWIAVPEEDLPVKLPFIKDFRPTGREEAPLASVKKFYEVKCPKCGNLARRETDVSDTFLDSAWYYIAYLSADLISGRKKKPSLKFNPFSNSLVKKWLPVDMYIGGAEHAVLHLLYVRFLALALHDMKLLNFGSSSAPKGEPFPVFRAHGLLIKEGAKMSKSRGNVVNPDEYIKKFGADTLRMYLMFLAPFEKGGDFRDAGILGMKRFLDRIWSFYFSLFQTVSKKSRSNDNKRRILNKNFLQETERLFARTIKKVTEDIESLHFNTSISALMIVFNHMEENKELFLSGVVSGNYKINYFLETFLKLLAPFAPYLSEELWQTFQQKLGNKNIFRKRKQNHFQSIHLTKWPVYKNNLAQESVFELVIQFNGRMRDKILVDCNITQVEAQKLVLERDKVKSFLVGKKIKKIIFVPNRLINIVTESS